jgi:hypothetical protein
MSRWPARIALLLACLAAAGYAAFLTWSSERQSRQLNSSAPAFDAAARSARAGLVELRAAQQAYVAAGQGQDFWFARVSTLAGEARDTLGTMKALAQPPAALAIDDAVGALDDFDRIDARARALAADRQLTAAASVIFGDGLELSKHAAEGVERAVAAELSARDEALAALLRRQEYALAGAASAIALTLLLLLPVARQPVPQPPVVRPVVPAPAATSGSGPLRDDVLADLDDFGVVSHARRVPPGEPSKFPPPKPLVAKVTPKPPIVSLPSVASLCGDLARVSDTQALPQLLERAAGVLDASGIVVWIADPDGRELTPILVHGYPPQLAVRLGNLARDAENVTASAYRTALLQTVKGDTVANGAIAAPLVSAAGCVGVMAAEMKNGGEQQEPLLAAATIIASQLATLVGPPPVRRAEAAG